MNTIPQLADCSDLANKYVIVRGSLNVPVVDGSVVNRFRLERLTPTLKHLTDIGAKV